MITRVSEAWIREGKRVEFLDALIALVRELPARHPGLLSHDILVDSEDPDRVLYVSRWDTEDALRSFAGEDWRTAPVTFPGEEALLRVPLALRHFVPL